MKDREEFERVAQLEAQRLRDEWEAQIGNPNFQLKALEDRVAKLKSEFDDLVREREKARMEIDEDVEGSDSLYLALEQAVIEAAKALEDARYDLRYAS